MRNLTVFQRLALIIGILSLALVAVTGGQFMTLRSTLIDERQVKQLEEQRIIIEQKLKKCGTVDTDFKTSASVMS